MPTDIPPPGPERDAEIARLLGVAPNRRAIATEDGTSSALTEDDPMGAGLGGYKITAEDVRDFCRKHPRYHVGAWEFWPPYSTDPAACDRLVEEMVRRGFVLVSRAHLDGTHSARFMIADAASNDGLAYYGGEGGTRTRAVSAAALLALRGGR